jgi:hypothetical protein
VTVDGVWVCFAVAMLPAVAGAVWLVLNLRTPRSGEQRSDDRDVMG